MAYVILWSAMLLAMFIISSRITLDTRGKRISELAFNVITKFLIFSGILFFTFDGLSMYEAPSDLLVMHALCVCLGFFIADMICYKFDKDWFSNITLPELVYFYVFGILAFVIACSYSFFVMLLFCIILIIGNYKIQDIIPTYTEIDTFERVYGPCTAALMLAILI